MKRILLIEDDAKLANIYSSRLQAQNYRVDIAPDGQSGYYAVYESKPDAVLLDPTVPQMGGVALIGKLRAQKQFQRLPVFILVESYASAEADEALAAGANHLINKTDPEALNELVSILNDVLNPHAKRNARNGFRRESDATSLPVMQSRGGLPSDEIEENGQTSRTARIGRIPFSAKGAGITPEPVDDRVPVTPGSASLAAASWENTGLQAGEEIRTEGKPSSSMDTVALLRDLAVVFLEDYGKLVHRIRKQFVSLTTAKTEEEKNACAQGLHAGILKLKANCQQCEIKGLERLCTGLEPLTKGIAEGTSTSGASMQSIANAIDLLAALDNRTDEIVPLNEVKPLVLLVDDENVSRKAMTLGLQKNGIAVVAVDRADAALKDAEDRIFDLMFLDVEMPGLNGFALCARIRMMAQHKKVPIIFISALNDLRTRASSRISGGNHFVTKPVNHHELALTAWTFIFRARLKP